MRPFTFITQMFVLTTGTFSTLTEFKTVTSRRIVKASLGRRGLDEYLAYDRWLGMHPQFPVNDTPWERSRLRLPQKPEVFIIKLPIVAPGCQILNHLPIFHEGGGPQWGTFGSKRLRKHENS